MKYLKFPSVSQWQRNEQTDKLGDRSIEIAGN